MNDFTIPESSEELCKLLEVMMRQNYQPTQIGFHQRIKLTEALIKHAKQLEDDLEPATKEKQIAKQSRIIGAVPLRSTAPQKVIDELTEVSAEVREGQQTRIESAMASKGQMIGAPPLVDTAPQEVIDELATASAEARNNQRARSASETKSDKVWLHAHVEEMFETDDYMSVDRTEWEAMSKAQQWAYISEFANDTMNNAGGCSASVVDASEVPEEYLQNE